MKKIKVKICGGDITAVYGYSYFIFSILQKYYEVELSENPDYLFFHESTYDHYKYDDSIKIFYTGENISPNFNLCDYAFGFDYMTFEDRYYRLPLYLVRVFYNLDDLITPEKSYLTEPPTPFTKKNLLSKTGFCSFVYSNYRASTERKEMFEMLSKYKKVSSAGSYLNNIGGEKLADKLSYERNHKFSIAFENSSRSGYTTEKIVSAFAAQTIPIYWGNPKIDNEFNTKRFINCHDYNSFNEVIERVKEIDSDDDLYLKMVNEKLQAPGADLPLVREKFDDFIQNIIDQDLLKAKRRTINPVKALELRKYAEFIESSSMRSSRRLVLLTKLYRPFKKIKVIERLKYRFFKMK